MSAFGCVNNTILLTSGRYLDLNDPKRDQFTLNDIAGALSRICRFGGQVPRFYSVAEHCCHCFDVAVHDAFFWDSAPERTVFLQSVLFHDAAEAFLGDVVRPLKELLPDYKAIEKRMQSMIMDALRIHPTAELANHVRRIDMELLIAERMAIWGDDGVKWTGQDLVKSRTVGIRFWNPEQAKEEFLRRAHHVGVWRNEYGEQA